MSPDRILGPVADVSVLVADAQPLFAEALRVTLSEIPGFSVLPDSCDTAEGVVDAAIRLRPRIALVDYWIGGRMAAPAMASVMREELPSCAVLLLSWVHGPDHIRSALAAGAAGFLPKSLAISQVVEAMQRAAMGESPVYAEELQRMVAVLHQRNEEADRRRECFMTLSTREVEVLRLLARDLQPGEIANDLFVSAGTVRNYIYSILRKLDARTQQEAVWMARLEGLVPPDGSLRPSGRGNGHA